MIASRVDLVAMGLMAAMLPISLVIQAVAWWRRRDTWQLSELSDLVLPLLLVLVAMIICGQSAVDERHAILLTLQWCGYLAVFAVAMAAPRRWVLSGVMIVGLPLLAITLGETVATGGRARWLSGNPNIQAAWILPLAFLIDWPVFQIYAGLGLVATVSRGGILAALVGFCAQMGADWRYLLLAAIVATGALWAVRPGTVTNRFLTWEEAVRLFWRRPLTGWGPGCYTLLARNEPGHPHADNLLLTVAAEMGVVGLAAWLWLIVAAGRLAVRSSDPARFGLLAIGVHQLFDNTVFWPWPGIMLMVTLALVAQERVYATVSQ